MFCRKCGNELSQDMKFCNKCGTRVEKQETSNNLNRKVYYEKTIDIDSVDLDKINIAQLLVDNGTWRRNILSICDSAVIRETWV